MNGDSLALVLLAAAVPLWSRARVAGMRLAELDGRPPPGARLRSRFSGVPPPRLLLAGSVGSLTAVGVGWPYGPPLGVAAGAAAWWLAGRAAREANDADPLGVAAAWDLLAACLRAGLPVPTAVAAIAGDLPAEAGRALRSAADLLVAHYVPRGPARRWPSWSPSWRRECGRARPTPRRRRPSVPAW